MVEKNKPAITINAQYVKDLSLEIPRAPEVFKELKTAPSVNIEVDIDNRRLDDGLYNVALSFHLRGEIGGKNLFILELVYACVVGLNVPEEHIEPVLMIEVPKLLFPFARSIITSNLMDAGLPPFMINPIDFVAMYQAKKSLKN